MKIGWTFLEYVLIIINVTAAQYNVSDAGAAGSDSTDGFSQSNEEQMPDLQHLLRLQQHYQVCT